MLFIFGLHDKVIDDISFASLQMFSYHPEVKDYTLFSELLQESVYR